MFINLAWTSFSVVHWVIKASEQACFTNKHASLRIELRLARPVSFSVEVCHAAQSQQSTFCGFLMSGLRLSVTVTHISCCWVCYFLWSFKSTSCHAYFLLLTAAIVCQNRKLGPICFVSPRETTYHPWSTFWSFQYFTKANLVVLWAILLSVSEQVNPARCCF